jgi:hypothetical protein
LDFQQNQALTDADIHRKIRLMTTIHTPSTELQQAVHAAVKSALSDPAFTRHLAEEIADILDGFDDNTMGRAMGTANNGDLVSEAEVLAALKGK